MRTFLLLVLILASLSTSVLAKRKKKRYQTLNYYYTSAKLQQPYKNDPNRRLGPKGKNPALTKVVNPRPDSIVEDSGIHDNNGINSEIRVVKQNRSQVRNANFGIHAGIPGYALHNGAVKPKKDDPPNPSVLEPPPQNLKKMSRKQRNQIAQVRISCG